MNVERLHSVAQRIMDELGELNTRDYVQQLSNGLEAVVNNPADTGSQQVLSDSRVQLQRTLPDAPSNKWPPTDRQTLEEIGVADVVGQALLDRIEGVLARNQMTPSVAHNEIEPIRVRLDEVAQRLTSLAADLNFFSIGRDDLVDEYELGIAIPRQEVSDSSLPELGKEFVEWQKILAPYEELAGVGVADFRVRAISSSEFGLFLAAIPPVVLLITKAVNDVLDAYQKLLNIKRMRSEMAAEVPEERLTSIDEYANTVMTQELIRASTELVAQAPALEEGRANELEIAVRVSLNKIANRIDAGYSIDIRTPPLPPEPEPSEEGKEVDPAALAAYNQALEIKQLAERVKRLEAGGSRILELPEGGNSPEEDPSPGSG
jgi:hypothetical protein